MNSKPWIAAWERANAGIRVIRFAQSNVLYNETVSSQSNSTFGKTQMHTENRDQQISRRHFTTTAAATAGTPFILSQNVFAGPQESPSDRGAQVR